MLHVQIRSQRGAEDFVHQVEGDGDQVGDLIHAASGGGGGEV